MQRAALRNTVVGAELPQIAELAGDAKSYAERLFQFPPSGTSTRPTPAGPLTEPAAAEEPLFDPAALDRAVEVTGGCPYFLQELGSPSGGSPKDRPSPPTTATSAPLYESKLDS